MKRFLGVAALATVLGAGVGQAVQPPPGASSSPVAREAFVKPELYLSSDNLPLGEARARGRLNAARERALGAFFQRHGGDFNVWVDPRSGAATNLQGHIPLIPGDGLDNRVTLREVGQRLGRAVAEVDEAVVGELLLRFASDSADALGIDASQLGTPRVTRITETLWQVHIPQQFQGLPVRHGRLAATLSHGNLVLIGTEGWGNVRLGAVPLLSGEQALERGLVRAGLTQSPRALWKEATLEVLPVAPQGGEGLAHRLVWAYGFQAEGDESTWEVFVDAHTSEVLAIEDRNQYADASITGGVYPLTSTEICPSNEACGAMQARYPMPWADTGVRSAPYTDGAGVFAYTSGTLKTALSGKYIGISDKCGPLSNSASGSIDLGGVNGQHDCTSGGGSAGNTPAARSAFYELNRLAEQARGWLPSNSWAKGKLTSNVNINSTCNAYWSGLGNSVNFYRSGGGCRNTGEIGAVFDHEWGHGLDDNDANGTLSSSSEGYADIAAIYRLQTSCVGHGFFHTSDRGCGLTADGTGYNQNEAQTGGAAHCDLDCSGVRDADWAKHSDNTPDTPQNFVCVRCNSASSGLCGRQTHCAAAPTRQAAWDLVARDLRAAPFHYDADTAFLVGNKLFFQGSGNVGAWHACDCAAGTSSGCGSTNGYMQWLAADDDNGNLGDGTPHMTALYNAFARHNIACASPTPQNGGCASGPSSAPSVTLTPGTGQVALSWTGVANASSYWVMKTEGHAGCNLGKALKATVSGTSWTDPEVLSGRPVCYSVVAAGSSSACYGPASTCACVTPN